MIHLGCSVYNSEFLSKKPNNSYQKKCTKLFKYTCKKQLVMQNYIALV